MKIHPFTARQGSEFQDCTLLKLAQNHRGSIIINDRRSFSLGTRSLRKGKQADKEFSETVRFDMSLSGLLAQSRSKDSSEGISGASLQKYLSLHHEW